MPAGGHRNEGLTPRKVGKYHILARIGSGGMADVYVVTTGSASGFHKLFALKVMRPALAAEPEALRMFLDEARLASRLSHQNVLQTFETSRDGANYFLVMEYLEGCSLGTVRKAAGRSNGFPLGLQIQFLADALKGLHYAHELQDYDGTHLNIVHRDISAHNIFLTYDGQVKVLDFGIAKAAGSLTQTQSGIIKGTMRYISPEALLGEVVDRRADVYSSGVLLWEALTGESLWNKMAEGAIMRSVLADGVPDPREAKPDLPDVLAEICCRATALERHQRHASANELAVELEAALDANKLRSSIAASDFLNKLFAQRREQVTQMVQTRLKALENHLRGEHAGNADVSVVSFPAFVEDHTTMSPAGGTQVGFDTSSQSAMTGAGESSNKATTYAAIAGVVAVASVAIGGVMLMDSERAQPAQSTAGEAFADAKAAKAKKKIRFELRVRPAHAAIKLDDRPLTNSPVSMELPRDNESHILEVTAPGYRSRVMQLQLNRDVSLQLELEKANTNDNDVMEPQDDTADNTDIRRRRRRTRPKRSTENTEPASPAQAPPRSKKPKKGMDLDTFDPYN